MSKMLKYEAKRSSAQIITMGPVSSPILILCTWYFTINLILLHQTCWDQKNRAKRSEWSYEAPQGYRGYTAVLRGVLTAGFPPSKHFHNSLVQKMHDCYCIINHLFDNIFYWKSRSSHQSTSQTTVPWQPFRSSTASSASIWRPCKPVTVLSTTPPCLNY